ncbi:hypothetical protein LINGRAHAP2_LOCUS35075 [Linum grandiflorum]
MKAKYYRNLTALEAEVGNNPCFIWRSLMSAQDLISHDTRWRIGNGVSVHIWEDRWVSTLPGNYIPSLTTRLLIDATVRDLIDPDSDDCNPVLVESFSGSKCRSYYTYSTLGNGKIDCQIWHTSKMAYTRRVRGVQSGVVV